MPSLKFPLKKNEFVMDKVNKELFFVVKLIETPARHSVILRREKDDEITDQPFHMINRAYVKADVNVWNVLYGDKPEVENATVDGMDQESTDTDASNSGSTP